MLTGKQLAEMEARANEMAERCYNCGGTGEDPHFGDCDICRVHHNVSALIAEIREQQTKIRELAKLAKYMANDYRVSYDGAYEHGAAMAYERMGKKLLEMLKGGRDEKPTK